jgi:hypothetical protein
VLPTSPNLAPEPGHWGKHSHPTVLKSPEQAVSAPSGRLKQQNLLKAADGTRGPSNPRMFRSAW